MSSSSKPTVLIIGGGLGGLTLAQSLRASGIPYKIFERDSSLESRAQGWSLLLHECLPALRKIAPPSAPPIESISVTYNTPYTDHFHMFNGYTKETFLTFEGPVFADEANKRDAYSISASRSKFRSWLTNDLEVNWGYAFKDYELLSNGRVRAHFENGSSEEGDILVGADGAQSRVRTQLFSSDSPLSTLHRLPHACVAGLVHLPRERYLPHMAYGPSLYTTDATGLRVFIGLRKFSDDMESATLVWLLFWVEKEEENAKLVNGQESSDKPSLATLNSATSAAQLAYARQVTKDLHPDFKEIFAETKEEDMLGSLVLYDRVPVPCPEGPVTLIGDAMHVMSPFRGEGGNSALTDAFELCEILTSTQSKTASSIDSVLRAFETKMIPRATEAVLNSREAGAEFGTTRATEKLFNRAELGSLVSKG